MIVIIMKVTVKNYKNMWVCVVCGCVCGVWLCGCVDVCGWVVIVKVRVLIKIISLIFDFNHNYNYNYNVRLKWLLSPTRRFLREGAPDIQT